jgi:hypothetical protein
MAEAGPEGSHQRRRGFVPAKCRGISKTELLQESTSFRPALWQGLQAVHERSTLHAQLRHFRRFCFPRGGRICHIFCRSIPRVLSPALSITLLIRQVLSRGHAIRRWFFSHWNAIHSGGGQWPAGRHACDPEGFYRRSPGLPREKNLATDIGSSLHCSGTFW